MKAVVYRRYGGPEVLEYTGVPDPKVAQNSVLVRVRAAALNPADHLLQAGLGESHTDAWFPVIPGWDVSGVVERVGAGVSEFAPGDEVIGYIRQDILHHGAYAELADRGDLSTGTSCGSPSGIEAAASTRQVRIGCLTINARKVGPLGHRVSVCCVGPRTGYLRATTRAICLPGA